MGVRDEIHLTCALVWAWVLRDGRCAVVRNMRADGSSWWSLPGGGVEAGETLAEAAEREAREETGLTVRARGLAWLGEEVRPEGRWMYAEFVAEVVDGAEDPSGDPSGTVREVRWVGRDEAEHLLGGGRGATLERLLHAPPDPANYRILRRD